MSHMRTREKTFSNEELVKKILRSLNHSWQPKDTLICESRDLEALDTHTYFGKSQEDEMELKRLAIDDEWGKNRKSLVLKAKDFDFDGDMSLIIKKTSKYS